jgi:hypothetical protein
MSDPIIRGDQFILILPAHTTPTPPPEQEVVNTSFQVEKLFNHPYPWERWFINSVDNGQERRFKPVQPDLNAIRQACNEVGLMNIPLLFHDVRFGYGTTFKIPYAPAVVSFNHCLSPMAASCILWHELRHAAQHEQGGYAPMTQRMPEYHTNPYGYWYHPDEVDARSYEKYGIDFPLVVESDTYIPDTINWSTVAHEMGY